MKIRKPSHGVAIGYVALFFAMSGTAVAATDGNAILGRNNFSNQATTFTITGNDEVLDLRTRPDRAPLTVNSRTKVGNLNADFLDGFTGRDYQRAVQDGCEPGEAVTFIDQVGSIECTAPQVIEVLDEIDDTGVGFAECPDGFTVTGGGYEANQESEEIGVADAAEPFLAPDGTDTYFVSLFTLAGETYPDGGIVTARCAIADLNNSNGLPQNFQRAAGAPKQAKALKAWNERN